MAVKAGEWFVVKIGGELASDRVKLANTVGRAVKEFLAAGIKVCIIHGGGPQATELSKRLNLETKQVGGRRITDAATLEVMKMTVAGQVSVDVASALRLAQVNSVCTSGVSSGLIEAVKRPPVVVTGGGPDPVDFGHVGDVTAVNVALLEKLAAANVVVVISCLGADAQGNVYNINADTVATRVASKLSAAKLLLVSNVPGVLRDKNDPTTRIATLTAKEAEAQIAAGVIQGGMIPKVEESFEMLDEGIDAIHIVGLNPDTAILEEATNAGSRGTAFLRG